MSPSRQRIATARSLLFVPGHRPDRFDKAASSGADLVILDLEDAVADADKNSARSAVDHWLAEGNDAVVRINPPGTPWFDDDIKIALARGCPVMVPKADDPSSLADLARPAAARCPLILLVETAAGIEHAAEIGATTGAVRLALGNADLAAELGIEPDNHAALAYARSRLVFASAAVNLAPPIDGVITALDDQAALQTDISHARQLGFTGKLCVHPCQVEAVAAGFSPPEQECAWAREIVTAAGSVTRVNGQMVDKPVVARARRILAIRHD